MDILSILAYNRKGNNPDITCGQAFIVYICIVFTPT